MRVDRRLGNEVHATDASVDGGTRLMFPPADNVQSSTRVTTKVRTGGDGAVGHNRSGNVGLDEHAIRQGGVGGLVLLRRYGIQDRSVDPQRTHRGSPRSNGGWRGSRGDASSGVGILIALGGDASE